MANILFENVSYLDGLGTATTKRTPAARGTDIVNALSFNVDRTGAADSTLGLQAALTAAANGTLYIPAGTYKVTAPLTLPGTNISSIKIIGGGKENTTLIGNVTGYMIDLPSNGLSSQAHQFCVLADLSMNNTAHSPGNGCFRAGYIDNNASIRDCIFQGYIGINVGGSAANNAGSFGCSVSDCWFLSGITPTTADQGRGAFPSGSTGCYMGQGTMTDCRFQNWRVALYISEQCAAIMGCSVEVSDYGIVVGSGPDGVTGVSSVLVSGYQTEDVGNAFVVTSASNLVFTSSSLTGQRNPTNPASIVAPTTWATGIAHVTTAVPHNIPAGTHNLYLEFIGSSGAGAGTNWLVGGNIQSCTVTGPSTFTYSLAADPGTFTAGVGTDWNYINTVGIGIQGSVTDSAFISIALSLAADFVVDLNSGGSASATNCSMMNIQGGGVWNAPPALQKASWYFVNCGDQLNAGNTNPKPSTFAMHFADLPGQVSAGTVEMKNAYEGMQYDIVDCQCGGVACTPANAFLAVASGGGTGAAAHRRVRYNAALPGWQVVG
jgi:hypothetical protein